MSSVPETADHAEKPDDRLVRSAGLHPPRPLSRAGREQFLAEPHVAVLSVAAEPGRPPASIPLWYDYRPGGNIVVNTSATSRKARLVRAAGAVTLTVQRAAVPYGYVVVEGEVVEMIQPAPIETRRAIAARYLNEEGAAAVMDRYDPDDQVLLVIKPRKWHTADFSEPSSPEVDRSSEPALAPSDLQAIGARHDQ